MYQDWSFVVIKTIPKKDFFEQVTDRIKITVEGKDEDELFRAADEKMHEITDRFGPYCDPDDVGWSKPYEKEEEDFWTFS